MIKCKKRFSEYISTLSKSSIFVTLFVLLVFATSTVKAQTLDEAKELAYNGERAKAREMCRKILAGGFDSDVAVLMARTYAWDGKYDSTRVYLTNVLDQFPEHRDAMDCLSDVQYWEEKYPEALKSCDIMLAKDPKDETFMLKRAKILNAMKQYDQAAEQLEALLKIYPSNAEARTLLDNIRLDQMKNRIRIGYTLDLFEKSADKDPWHLIALSYERKTPIGLVIARVNGAERYGNYGLQYEADAYPIINKNNYAYLNMGFSDNLTIFPKIRAGAEWYHIFPKSFEASLGMRALYYSNSDSYTYTGMFGKYAGNYWFSARTYVTPFTTSTAVSGYIETRRYFGDPENYIGLRLGYGVSPDDRSFGSGTSSDLQLKSQLVRTEYNHIFNRLWTTKVALSLNNQELPDVGYVMNYSFEFMLGRFF